MHVQQGFIHQTGVILEVFVSDLNLPLPPHCTPVYVTLLSSQTVSLTTTLKF